MKLLTYRLKKGGAPRVGVLLEGNRIAPLAAPDMLAVIAAGRKAIKLPRKGLVPLSAMKLLAPIPRPRKNVFCVGWNYLEHFQEGAKARAPGVELPAHPTFFTKAPTTVNGPYDTVPAHAGITEKLDWEVELGVIIGKGGINIAEADAINASRSMPMSDAGTSPT